MPENLMEIKARVDTTSGSIRQFLAFANGRRMLMGPGPTQEGKATVPEGPVTFKVRVWGIDNSRYSLHLDLPGGDRDSELNFQLDGGYHEFELHV